MLSIRFGIGTVNSGVLFFNISGVEPNEAILHAELRLFRHRQKGIYVVSFWFITVTTHREKMMSGAGWPVQVEIYQISDLHQPADQNRLLVTKYIDAGDSAWETFNIHAAVVDWVSGESANLGLLVVTTSLQGDRSRLFRDGPLSVGDRAPILVLFSNSPSLASTPSYKQELSSDNPSISFIEKHVPSIRHCWYSYYSYCLCACSYTIDRILFESMLLLFDSVW